VTVTWQSLLQCRIVLLQSRTSSCHFSCLIVKCSWTPGQRCTVDISRENIVSCTFVVCIVLKQFVLVAFSTLGRIFFLLLSEVNCPMVKACPWAVDTYSAGHWILCFCGSQQIHLQIWLSLYLSHVAKFNQKQLFFHVAEDIWGIPALRLIPLTDLYCDYLQPWTEATSTFFHICLNSSSSWLSYHFQFSAV
jgi:hypothetical protein